MNNWIEHELELNRARRGLDLPVDEAREVRLKALLVRLAQEEAAAQREWLEWERATAEREESEAIERRRKRKEAKILWKIN